MIFDPSVSIPNSWQGHPLRVSGITMILLQGQLPAYGSIMVSLWHHGGGSEAAYIARGKNILALMRCREQLQAQVNQPLGGSIGSLPNFISWICLRPPKNKIFLMDSPNGSKNVYFPLRRKVNHLKQSHDMIIQNHSIQ